MMATHHRGPNGEGQGIEKAMKDTLPQLTELKEENLNKTVLVNKAGESKSPYVRGHAKNPVAWQLWGEDTISLARKENKLLFVSIGYSACHCEYACHGRA
jgi:hypothetical protein